MHTKNAPKIDPKITVQTQSSKLKSATAIQDSAIQKQWQ
jgi:hypothetical protein